MEVDEFQGWMDDLHTGVHGGKFRNKGHEVEWLAAAIAGEAGEIIGETKRITDRHAGDIPPYLRTNILTELGDCIVYALELAKVLDMPASVLLGLAGDKAARWAEDRAGKPA